MEKAILIERDFKGEYERYALTYEEFCDTFKCWLQQGMPLPQSEGCSYTMYPLVHVWYKPCDIGSEEWNLFFTDMSWEMAESDIESGNFAYVREDFMESLKKYLPQNVLTSNDKPSLESLVQAAENKLAETTIPANDLPKRKTPDMDLSRI